MALELSEWVALLFFLNLQRKFIYFYNMYLLF